MDTLATTQSFWITLFTVFRTAKRFKQGPGSVPVNFSSLLFHDTYRRIIAEQILQIIPLTVNAILTEHDPFAVSLGFSIVEACGIQHRSPHQLITIDTQRQIIHRPNGLCNVVGIVIPTLTTHNMYAVMELYNQTTNHFSIQSITILYTDTKKRAFLYVAEQVSPPITVLYTKEVLVKKYQQIHLESLHK